MGVDAGLGVGVGVGVLDDRPEVHVTELPSALRTHCMVEPVLVSVPAPGGAGLSALPAGGTGTTDRTGGADEFPGLTVTVLVDAAVVEVEPVFTICRSCWLADCLTACTCAWREESSPRIWEIWYIPSTSSAARSRTGPASTAGTAGAAAEEEVASGRLDDESDGNSQGTRPTARASATRAATSRAGTRPAPTAS